MAKNKILFAACLVVFVLFTALTLRRALAAGELVKGSLPGVYYITADGKRLVFPNKQTYLSWYPDFSGVQAISDSQLAKYPLAGNVTMKPGVKMIKVTTDPKVYAIAEGGLLRWVSTEALARSLYGTGWNKQIIDVPDAFFVNYQRGADITGDGAGAYSPANATNNSTTIDIEHEKILAERSAPAVTPAGCNYGNPSCSADQTCINNTCVLKTGCQYSNPSCAAYEMCQNNSCLRNTTPSGVIAEYLTCMSTDEKTNIDSDFDLQFVDDGTTVWSTHPYSCDFATKEPTRLVLYNSLRLLKDITFSKELPFTNGASIYDYLTLKTVSPDIFTASSKRLSITPATTCSMGSYGYNNLYQYESDPATVVNFDIITGGSMSRLYPTTTGDASCQEVNSGTNSPFLLNDAYYNPVYAATLIVHESRHAISSKWHDAPNGADKTIDQMGAWAAQFYFQAWIALYGTNVDANTKQLAKEAAADILKSRFTENRCPSDQSLKSVVNQITPGTCP